MLPLGRSDLGAIIPLRLTHLALGLHDVSTDVERLVLALLDEDRVADLAVPLHPDHGLERGHVHAELLVRKTADRCLSKTL
jgi:hypothetical protein